jgi:small conductance mechanosensitive channel
MDMAQLTALVMNRLANLGLQILGALALFVVGRWLIGFVVSRVARGLERQHVDPTVLRYVGNIVSVGLNVILVVALLGYFGVETTTFAALLAGAGLAIGAAWSGLLANFAAGGFIVVLRPYKVGDFITAGGVTGTVKEIGLFVTTVNTMDNVQTYIGNNKIFSDTIQNFTVNPYRRVDLVAQLDHSVDPAAAMQLLKSALAKIPNVATEPQPEVELLTFTMAGPVLAVRPYCHNDHYWQVYFDTNRAIHDTFAGAGYPAPEQHFALRTPIAIAAKA